MGNKRFYWLVGDRSLCLERKRSIIENLSKEKKWEIKNIDSDIKEFNHFYKEMNSRNIFGNIPTIYVFSSNIKKDENLEFAINTIQKDKVLILIEKRENKTSKFYKKYKKNIEVFRSLKNEQGYVDNKEIKNCQKVIEKITNKKIKKDRVDLLIKFCDFDYGCILREIEKLDIYSNGDIDSISDNEFLDLIKNEDNKDISTIIDSIREKKTEEALCLLEENLQSPYIKSPISFFQLLSENFYFMLFCRMAQDSGYSNHEQIGEFVSEVFLKNSKERKGFLERKTTPQSAKFRFFYYKESLILWKTEHILKAIRNIEKNMDYLLFENFPPNVLIRDFILKSTIIK